jgi:hypothetical protein
MSTYEGFILFGPLLVFVLVMAGLFALMNSLEG